LHKEQLPTPLPNTSLKILITPNTTNRFRIMFHFGSGVHLTPVHHNTMEPEGKILHHPLFHSFLHETKLYLHAACYFALSQSNTFNYVRKTIHITQDIKNT
jgi:hypothetical protein